MAEATTSCIDYDADFEKMLNDLKGSELHSSFNDLRGRERSPIVCTPSPRSRWRPRPPQELLWTPNSPPHPQPQKQATLENKEKRRTSGNLMQIENIIIELSDDESEMLAVADYNDDEEGSEDSFNESGIFETIDLNGTYTEKTMCKRRLSQMLDVLQELQNEEDEEEFKKQEERAELAFLSMAHLKLHDDAESHVNTPKYPHVTQQLGAADTPSPHTPPLSTKKLDPERNFRLCNVSAGIKRPHEASISYNTISPQTPINTMPLQPERSFRLCSVLEYEDQQQPTPISNKRSHVNGGATRKDCVFRSRIVGRFQQPKRN